VAGAVDLGSCLFAKVVGRNPGGFLFSSNQRGLRKMARAVARGACDKPEKTPPPSTNRRYDSRRCKPLREASNRAKTNTHERRNL
jgi:hypothetical protein